MGAKVDRIEQIVGLIADQLHVSATARIPMLRAARLCKADLVTQMVGEFPELQGIMGENYALQSGEDPAVAIGIREHYLPKGAIDQLPQTLVGQVVALADRLDTLVSIFGLGLVPTGSSDPFALRRAANAIVHIIWAANLNLDLQALLEQAIAIFTTVYPKAHPESLLQQLQEFFGQRLRNLLEEQGIDYDLINAVQGDNDPEYTERSLRDLGDIRDRAQFLQTIRRDGRLSDIYETVNRSSRLATQGDLATDQLDPILVVDPSHFQKASEHAFYQDLIRLCHQMQGQRDYSQLVAALTAIAPTVSSFFDGPDSVLVMDSDPAIKRNRLNLLGLLRNQARMLADFGAIVKS